MFLHQRLRSSITFYVCTSKEIFLDQTELISKYENLYSVVRKVPTHTPHLQPNNQYIMLTTPEYISRISALPHNARFVRPDLLTIVNLLTRKTYKLEPANCVKLLNYTFTTKFFKLN